MAYEGSVKTTVRLRVDDGCVYIDDEFLDGIMPPEDMSDAKIYEVVSTLLTQYGLSELHSMLPEGWDG